MDALRNLHTQRYAGVLVAGTVMTGVTAIVKNEHVVLFLGENGLHVMSRDHGRTYTPIYHAERLSDFKLHPRKAGWMLASTLTRRCYTADADGLCFKNLMLSQDHGETWRAVQEYVVQYDWALNMKSHTGEYAEAAILAAVHRAEQRVGVHQEFGKWDPRVDFVLSTNHFETHTVLVQRGNRFLFTERYLAVAQVGADGLHVTLQLSADGGHKFTPAELEYPMTQHSYTILDTSNDAVFLHVNHEGEHAAWGNVYLSNSIGTNFTLSLPNNRR